LPARIPAAPRAQYTPGVIRMPFHLRRYLVMVALAAPALAAAHDIPADVTVQAFVRPEGDHLRVLVRVPLRAMRDIDFPTRGPGLLDLSRAEPFLHDAAMLWVAGSVDFYEGDTHLGAPRLLRAAVSLPSDRSFTAYDTALAHINGPALAPDTEIPWDQTNLDAVFDYPIASDRSRFSVRPAFARLGIHVVTVLRLLPPGGSVRAFEFAGDPGLVRLDPRWHQAAARFVRLGFTHILDGLDHLLFLACLVIPFRRVRALVVIVTAFTVAHSITLMAAAAGLVPDALWFPPLVETLIAGSILYMALDNILVAARGGAVPVRRRWTLAFAFGLVHGVGFSYGLKETLQFAGSHLLTSLVSFNAGIELGQLLIVALLLPVLYLLFTRIPERAGVVLLSAFVAHTGWHWMLERGERLRQFALPGVSPVLATRALIVAVTIAGVTWVVRAGRLRRTLRPAESTGEHVELSP
jgi:hypothetical protein